MADDSQAVMKTFAEYVATLRTRGGMFISPYNFDTLMSHIFGYETAIQNLGFDSPLEGMKELVYLRFGASRALFWTEMLRTYLADADDAGAINMFFEFFDDLSEIRRTRGIEFLRAEYTQLPLKKRPTNLRWPD